jgi:putative SOS response-associated peptidase YedK
MCGRFTLTTPAEALAEALGLDAAPELEARYNVAPSQPVLAVRARRDGAGREAVRFAWGLVVRDTKGGRPLINVRSESASRVPAYREAFRLRRCLIPADGFYEWRREGRLRQPYYVRRTDRAPFAFAGLWEEATRDGSASCAVLTTEPNRLLRGIHDRMPAILGPEAYAHWLDAGAEAAALAPLLRPYLDELLTLYPVEPWVNDAGHDDASCIEPQRRLL